LTTRLLQVVGLAILGAVLLSLQGPDLRPDVLARQFLFHITTYPRALSLVWALVFLGFGLALKRWPAPFAKVRGGFILGPLLCLHVAVSVLAWDSGATRLAREVARTRTMTNQEIRDDFMRADRLEPEDIHAAARTIPEDGGVILVIHSTESADSWTLAHLMNYYLHPRRLYRHPPRSTESFESWKQRLVQAGKAGWMVEVQGTRATTTKLIAP